MRNSVQITNMGDNGVSPPDGYMILGNVPAGSDDSTAFGLVIKVDFGGKVRM
jgi:hypothetical protein